MSEGGRGSMYSRESHPHTGDPRVDPSARKNKPVEESKDQMTLESSDQSLSQRQTVRVETLTIKRKKMQKIILNEGTRDEISFMGRVYGLRPGIAIRNLPAERRDSEIIYESQKNDFFFRVNGHDLKENGVPYFWGFVSRNNGIGILPTLSVPRPVVARKWDIQKKNSRPD